ncbi:MAG TPA: hypothetical protein VF123_15515 [Candidatus Sulfotelmatobacter sp.]
MKLQVECYSGYKAEERPVVFRIDGHEYRVEEVLDQWYGPADAWFKVRAHDCNLYILRRRTCVPHSEWDLVSFRPGCRIAAAVRVTFVSNRLGYE